MTLAAALRAARRGWPILPCHSPTGGGCSCGRSDCGSPGKHPRTRAGLHDASVDETRIRAWWRKWPDANLGIRTGSVSGLVVVDIDPDHGGMDSLAKLRARTEVPDGLHVVTGSGGLHLYFAHPGTRVPNSAGTALGPGIDVRGDGGYVIAPPSVHATGKAYRWKGHMRIPDLPGYLLERVSAAERPPQIGYDRRPPDQQIDAWARRAIDDEVAQVRSTPPGGRNHRLNAAAFSLGQIVGAGLAEPTHVVDQLHRAALSAGLGSREAIRTIRSGMRAGIQLPRGPAPQVPRPGHDMEFDAVVDL